MQGPHRVFAQSPPFVHQFAFFSIIIYLHQKNICCSVSLWFFIWKLFYCVWTSWLVVSDQKMCNDIQSIGTAYHT